jgi:hypothetical protein
MATQAEAPIFPFMGSHVLLKDNLRRILSYTCSVAQAKSFPVLLNTLALKRIIATESVKRLAVTTQPAS